MEQFEKRIVFFLDVLGFKDKVIQVEELYKNGKTECIDEILNAFKLIESDLDNDDEEEKYFLKNAEIVQVSDSIIISFPIQDDHSLFYSLREISSILIDLLDVYGWLFRGAVCKGMLYHRGNKIFGVPYQDAVEWEKKAKYPRVIVPEWIIDGAKNFSILNDSNQEEEDIKYYLKKDGDFYFIDYLSRPVVKEHFHSNTDKIKKYYERIQNLIDKNIQNPNLFEKYNWLQNQIEAEKES